MRAVLLLTVFCLMSLAGCTRAVVTGQRADIQQGQVAVPVRLNRLYLYSFLSINAEGRLGRDMERFRLALTKKFQDEGLTIISVDALKHASETGSSVTMFNEESNGRYLDRSVTSVPTREIIAANAADEKKMTASYRLILFPGVNNFNGNTGNFKNAINWHVERVADGVAIASGDLTYIADVRGVPVDAMVEQLLGQLRALDILPR